MNDDKLKNHADNIVIDINSVGKAFGARRVLSDVTISIGQGQSVCLCGVNGAGKSTLLRIIAGLLQPDAGHVHLCGYDIDKEPEKAKPKLGVISHKSMIYTDLTVIENLVFFAELYGVKDHAARVSQLIEDVGLFPYRYDKAGILSRGLLQRLAIARALVHQPAILLADEPFTGLDTEASRYLISVMTGFTGSGGTIVMTTHDINTGLQCCGRVVVLDKNHLIFDAKTAELDVDSFRRDYLAYARNKN